MLYSCLSPRDQTCLTVQRCTEYQNKNQRSWALHILGMSRYSLYFPKFHIHRMKCMNIHYVSIFHVSHITLPFKTARLHKPQSALQSAQYRVSIPNSMFQVQTPHSQVLNMLHENAFCRLHTPSPYPMFYSTFLQSLRWKLGPEFISIPSAKINNTAKFVPCEGRNVLNPSELL